MDQMMKHHNRIIGRRRKMRGMNAASEEHKHETTGLMRHQRKEITRRPRMKIKGKFSMPRPDRHGYY